MVLIGVLVSLVVATSLFALNSYVTKTCSLNPLALTYSPPPKPEGVWAPNNLLHGIEKIGTSQVFGPEDVVCHNDGNLYCPSKDGWLKRIGPSGSVENVTFVGRSGLGLAVGHYGEIILCEADKGLLNVTEDGTRVLSTEADGQKFLLCDGVDVAKDGTIYFTDASNKFGFHECNWDILEAQPNGRLLKYDIVTRTTSVLLRDLWFANGVALSEDESFLLFSETSRVRVSRYWLKGEKMGTNEVILDGLPGYPDNVHLSEGIFYVSLLGERSWAGDFVQRTPSLKCWLRLLLGNELLGDLHPKRARVLAVSNEGQVLKVYDDHNGKIMSSVTGARRFGEYLYVSSLYTNFIGRLKL